MTTRNAIILALVVAASSCMHAPPVRIAGEPAAPATRSQPWHAPRGVVPPEPAVSALPPTLPAELVARGASLSLADAVDLALRNNPQTQLSWAQARAAAASYGAAASAWIPAVDASANAALSSTTVGSSNGGAGRRETITPQLTLSYLLFDFGGRAGTAAAARDAAIALDLTHNSTLQNVALQVETAWFNLQALRGLVDASRQNLAEADTNLASARQRNIAGVATIADVLQAETLQAQAQLDLETAEGNLENGRGALAVAMGLPANTRYEIPLASDSLAVGMTALSVDTLVNRALELRPDLAAARTLILQSQAQARVARSAELPSITLGSNTSRPVSNQSNFTGLNYGLTLGISIPLFNLARPYNVQAAQAQVDASAARAALLRTQVTQQVFTAYNSLQTATQRAATTQVLIRSATASEAAARARYRAGVGTILDLITAQNALASARAQAAQARWTWATALAQLSHDVGVLGPRGEMPVPLAPPAPGRP